MGQGREGGSTSSSQAGSNRGGDAGEGGESRGTGEVAAGSPGAAGASDEGGAASMGGAAGAPACLGAGGSSGLVYENDFEVDAAGFDVTHTIALPSDAVGGISTYLGERTPLASTSAVLTLTGLTPGQVYLVGFDLYLGGTWDGGEGFGPDFFSLTSSSSGVLVNATFRNGFPIGDATLAQSYSDATPLGGTALFRTREGADLELSEPVYYFGHGAGNPRPAFTATATTETLSFRSVDAQGTDDEFFALDNVSVRHELAPCP